MKVNIYGLTDATISFNTIGMMLRGKYTTRGESNPCSVAYNIVIDNESQSNELMSVAKLGLIKVEVVQEEPQKEVLYEKAIESLQEPVVETRTEPKVESPRRKKDVKEKALVKPEPKKDNSAVDLEIPREDPKDNSSVVVMTSKGAVHGEMVHKVSGEIDENDPRCEKSMKAAQAIDEEREMEEEVEDGSYIDPSERSYSNAVVGTGSGKAATVPMQNTIFGERDEPQYIDLGDEDEVLSAFIDENEDTNEDVERAFISDDDDEDGLGDAFIEI